MKKSIIFFILAMSVYVLMMTQTIPKIVSETNGLPTFDMRPTGYSLLEGHEILDHISDEGVWLYTRVQLPLDFFYPPLLSLFAFHLLGAILKKTSFYKARWLSFTIMIFDYLENLGIYWIFSSHSDLALRLTSLFSILKAISTSLVLSMSIIALVYWIILRYFRKERLDA